MSVESITEALRPTSGGVVTLWTYSASLQELVLRVEFPGKSGNFHVVCNATRLVRCPTRWTGSSLAVQLASEDEMVLTDEAHDVRVVAGLIRVLTDVEPVFGGAR
jgi:hypothetical protein